MNAEWLRKTNSGRVVYERPPHLVRPTDALRMAKAIDDTEPSNPHYVADVLAIYDLKILAGEIWSRQGIELQTPTAGGLGASIDEVIFKLLDRFDRFKQGQRKLYEDYLHLIREVGLARSARAMLNPWGTVPEDFGFEPESSGSPVEMYAASLRSFLVEIRDLIVETLPLPVPDPAPKR